MPKKKGSSKQDNPKQILRAELRREVNYSKYNLTRAEKEWKQICVKIAVPKLREEVVNCWNHFEKIMDTKDFIISLIMDEIRSHEDTYKLNLHRNQESIQRLMQKLAHNLQEIHAENNEHLMNMIQKSLNDWENQMYETDIAESYLKVMKFGLEVISKRWDKSAKTEYFARLNEESSKHISEIQQLSFILELKLEDLWDRIKFTQDDYLTRIHENKKHHDIIKEVDDATSKTVQNELKKLMKLQVVAKRLAAKFKELVRTIGKKLKYLEGERDSLHELQFALRNKLMQDKDNDSLKRAMMTVEFAKVFEALNGDLRKGESMMRVVKGIHRYETSREKILPYPIRFYGLDFENRGSPPQMKLFWQRLAEAEAYRYTLNEERIYLQNENKKLKKQIHNYCKCLDCPSLPLIPQRAGKIPYTEGREMVQKQKTQNEKRSTVSGSIPPIR